jgi:hypothetical protein
MKKSRFWEAKSVPFSSRQKLPRQFLNCAASTTSDHLALFYRWRSKFGSMYAIRDGVDEEAGRSELAVEDDVRRGTA